MRGRISESIMRNISSGELKNASLSDLKKICGQLREEIVQTVSVCGGHLSSNLGTVELTVALHRVFSFPQDKIVFDVGHQCYAHKLLSGRAEKFHTLRQEGGISGFPKRAESEYDCYDTGHAGTAISAALGIAKARDLKGENFNVIALVGDGAFNNGLIYEALNSLKILNTNVLILLNDNGMSISPTVGGTHEVLTEMKDALNEEDVRLFERYGLTYTGVFNGNDLGELIPALQDAKEKLQSGCVLMHVSTRKGQGHPFCENAPVQTHGVSVHSDGKEYSRALGEELCDLAARNPRVVAVTAAMTDSLGLRGFFERYPERAFDVGICEEHASVLCAAMATEGMKPYYAIYSTFLQRAFDEIIHDVCGQNLPVTFCVDRAGITGADGETHQGVFDLSYLSFIPNLAIGVPKDIGEFRAMLRASEEYGKPFAIRYPRTGREGERTSVQIGEFEILHSTLSDVIVLAAGERCIGLAREALKRLQGEAEFTLINARFIKPLDEEMLSSRKEKYVVTVEDNAVRGGLGDAINKFYLNSGKQIVNIGYREAFIPHGEPRALAKEYGVSAEAIVSAVRGFYARG